MKRESLEAMKEREVRYERAKAASNFGRFKYGRTPSWAHQEMWDTCLGPAHPPSRYVPPAGLAEHERYPGETSHA